MEGGCNRVEVRLRGVSAMPPWAQSVLIPNVVPLCTLPNFLCTLKTPVSLQTHSDVPFFSNVFFLFYQVEALLSEAH